MMAEMKLVTREQEHQTAVSLYGDSQNLAELFEAVKKVAPWANDNQHPMSNAEIGLAIRRSVAMGLDPLNPHEVQIWKDGRGSVNFQLSYTLLAEWVRHFHGEHTEPQYHRLSAEELVTEGLNEKDIAYRVSFLMKSDIPNVRLLVDAGYTAPQARQMLEITGLGVADGMEYSSKYFAPAGRSKSWKVQKRALTDAYRRKFGTPTRSEIEELRRHGFVSDTEPQDWENTGGLYQRDAVMIAEANAKLREGLERQETDPEYKEHIDNGINALYGDAVDGVFTEAEQPELADDMEGMLDENDAPTDIALDDVAEIDPGDPEPEQVVAEKEPHWIDDTKIKNGFFAWVGDQGLDSTDVYKALAVESMHDFKGTIGEAKMKIHGWAAVHAR